MSQSPLNLTLLKQRIIEQYGTQSAFAQRQGWSKQYLSRVLTGRTSLSLNRASELAEALGIALSELVADNSTATLQPRPSLQVRETKTPYLVQTVIAEDVKPVETTPGTTNKLALKMTPELDALIRKHPEMEPLRALIADGRPWSELNQEERRERAELSRGILRWSPATVDDFLARKHAETAAEERKYAARS